MDKYQYKVISYKDYLTGKKEIPNLKYHWVESILLFLFPYPEDLHLSDKYLPAKFAYGEDYHQVIKRELTEIADKMQLNKYEVLVDISFLDEKACAVMAGLGEIGKNNLLLTKEFGSRVFIGEIVTDEVLYGFQDLPSLRMSEICLNCDLCITHCPTKALDNGFNINKCLSFLSQKPATDYSLYDNMTLFYGCDICQDVCPVNHQVYLSLPEFAYQDDCSLALDDVIKLTNTEFKEKYKNKAFNWINIERIIRNLIVLEANNNKLTSEDIQLYQEKFKNIDWLFNHLEYMKGKIKRGNN